MKFRTVLVALALLLATPAFSQTKAETKADPNAPISIETLANSRAVVTDRIQQLQAALAQLEGNKKQLDAEIDRRVAADKAKAKK